MACVAFPTCGLAMAESERYLPSLISKIEDLLDEAGVQDDEITIRDRLSKRVRVQRCRSCIYRKSSGTNVFRRAASKANVLINCIKKNIDENEILNSLRPLLISGKRRLDGEHFGDFVIRSGVVAKVHDGRDFHS